MPKYVVLYRFTEHGAKDIRGTVARARQTREQNEKRGFKVQALLWTQGPYDLAAVVEAPSEDAMMGGMVNIVSTRLPLRGSTSVIASCAPLPGTAPRLTTERSRTRP